MVVSKEPLEIKLIDFGFSKSGCELTSLAGTPFYMAPEISNKIIKNNSNKYTYKCDIWSMGIILYQAHSNIIIT